MTIARARRTRYAWMMLRSVALAVLLVGSTASAEVRYISVGADAVGTVRALTNEPDGIAAVDILAADRDVAVLAVDDADLDAIAREIHEHHGRCGGFIVHDTL